MRNRALWLTLTLFMVCGLALATGAQAQSEVIHVVARGETLDAIALRYGLTSATLAAYNGIANRDLIFAGQRLRIPPRPGTGDVTFIVAPGETLQGIAARFGLSTATLAAYNGIGNRNLIFAGQRLRIPTARVSPLAAATAVPAPTPTSIVCPCEAIVISNPTRGMTITSPVTVTGLASGFEQNVVVAVLDGSGGQIGLAPGTIAGEFGQQGPFTATVPFAIPANDQPGRIQVFSESPRDGAVEHLNSVTVMIQGLGLDPLLERLDRGVSTKDYAALQTMMADPFQLGFYKAEGSSLAPADAIQQLRDSYLGPGAPRLDFSVDARKLLGERVGLGPDVVHVVYSPGWGPEKNDDAFLFIGNANGRARWSGMLYVRHDLIDYR